MDVSIVIPSYNTQDTISDTLKCISEQIINCSLETVLVDCSDHTLVKAIADSFPDIRYIHSETRFNPGIGRNIGSQHAAGELLIFIDSDVQLDSHAIQNAWEFFNQGHRVFGGALELNTATSQGLSSWLEHYFFNHESQKNRPICERSNLSSALLCIDRKLFLEEGGFKDIPRMQDTELTERLIAKGHSLLFNPGILGYQTQDSSLSKVLKKTYINGQNLYYIRYKPTITYTQKVVFFALLPALGLLKVTRIIVRHLKYQSTKNRLITIALIVPLLIAAGYWTAGFYNALVTNKGISADR